MKKYPVGSLSLVVLLALLRTNDINNYFNDLYRNVDSEIILGPLAGYTQSSYGPRDPEDLGPYQHKNIDYVQSVLQNIHSLSRYRRFDGVETNINAWWYTSTTSSGSTDEDYVSDEADGDSVGRSNSISDYSDSENNLFDVGQAEARVDVEELSLEDMDLIDILWRQDIDLGIAKEFYDYDVKKKGDEIAAEQVVLQNLVDNSVQLPYAIDNETGEYLYNVPTSEPAANQQQPVLSIEPQSISVGGQQAQYTDEDLDRQLVELLQLADDTNSNTETSAPVQFYSQPTVDDEALAVSQDDLHLLDDLDIDALLQPLNSRRPSVASSSVAPTLDRQSSIDRQWNQLIALWNNSTRENISSATENAALPWLPEYLDEPPQAAHADMYSSSVSFTNVTDPVYPDALLNQLLENADSVFNGLNDTSDEGAVARLEPRVEKFVGSWLPADMYDGVDGEDSSESYSASSDQQLQPETDWRRGKRFSNNTAANASIIGRSSRHSVSSSLVSDDSLDSMVGAQHNHTYTSLVRPTATVRMRAAAPPAVDEEDDDYAMASRDAKRLIEMHIPLRYEDIVSTPVDKFNRLLQTTRLSESQMHFIRDVRRRGKNKVAAQNCRKRKLDVIQNLDGEVAMLQQRRSQLQHEQAVIAQRVDDVKMRMRELEDALLRSMMAENRQMHDSTYSLQLTADGAVYVVSGDGNDDGQSTNNRRKKNKKE